MSENLKFYGSVMLVLGIGVFAWHDLQKPVEEEAPRTALMDQARAMEENSKQPYIYRETKREQASREASEERLDAYNQENVEKFRAKIGSKKGRVTLDDVKHFTKGEKMGSSFNSAPTCQHTGWYYVSRETIPMGTGSHSTRTHFDFCGTSSLWDAEE